MKCLVEFKNEKHRGLWSFCEEDFRRSSNAYGHWNSETLERVSKHKICSPNVFQCSRSECERRCTSRKTCELQYEPHVVHVRDTSQHLMLAQEFWWILRAEKTAFWWVNDRDSYWPLNPFIWHLSLKNKPKHVTRFLDCVLGHKRMIKTCLRWRANINMQNVCISQKPDKNRFQELA